MSAAVVVVALGCAALIAWAFYRTRVDPYSDPDGFYLAGGVGVVLCALFVWISHGLAATERERLAACGRLLTASRTHADSFAVQMRCELPASDAPASVPVVVPVVIGR